MEKLARFFQCVPPTVLAVLFAPCMSWGAGTLGVSVAQPSAEIFNARQRPPVVASRAVQDRRLRRLEAQNRRLVAQRNAALAEAKALKLKQMELLKPPRVEMTAVLSFVDPLQNPVNGLSIQVEAYNKEGKVIQSQLLTTGTTRPGEASFVLKEATALLVPSLAPESLWELVAPKDLAILIRGTEGVVTMNSSQDPFSSGLMASLHPNNPPLMADPAGLLQSVIGQKKSPKKQPPKKPQQPKKGSAKPQTQSKPPQKVIKRVFRLPAFTVQRTSTDILFRAAPGSLVSVGSKGSAPVDGAGKVSITTPVSPDQKEITVVSTREESGRTFATEITIPAPDPYKDNEVDLPPLELVSLNDVVSPRLDLTGIGSMDDKEVQRALGKPQRISKALARDPDKFETWEYPKAGLELRLRAIRKSDSKNPKLILERVRFTSKEGGSVAGLTVGSTEQQVVDTLGKGRTPENEARPLGLTGYLQDGLVIKDNGSEVLWMEVRRPKRLLEAGIETAPPAYKTSIYLNPVEAGSSNTREAADQVKDWLSKTPGIEFVADKDQADYVLNVKVVSHETKTDRIIGAVPYKVNSTARIEYELRDPNTGEVAVNSWNGLPLKGVSSGTSRANFEEDVVSGAVIIGIALLAAGEIKDPIVRELTRVAIAAFGVWSVEKMKDIMDRARTRTEKLSVRNAVSNLAEDLALATGSPARVISAQRGGSTLRLNVGERHGLRVGSEFVIENGMETAFPRIDTGLRTEVTVARVTKMDSTTAEAEIYKLTSSYGKEAIAKDSEVRVDDGADAVLDPSTALVYAIPYARVKD